MPRLPYINLGCGNCFHADWLNYDLVPQAPGVVRWDATRGIPLTDESCEVVYHSHMLEHLRRDAVGPFLRDCRRVLRPGGIIRVATPDFEQACRLYLEKLAAAVAGTPGAGPEYEWAVLELLDQTVRETSGGGMREFLSRDPPEAESYVLRRIGVEGEDLIRSLRREREQRARAAPSSLRARFRHGLQALPRLPAKVRLLLARLLLRREERQALGIGMFRLGGEVHHGLYDRCSLGRLLREAGFSDPTTMSADQSRIPAWSAFHLDTLPDGTPRKPDSFYMEAVT